MESDKQLFKINTSTRIYDISEIEKIYETGVIEPKSTILVANDENSPFTPFKIETLIRLYGAEYPFRRTLVNRRGENEECDFFSTSSSDESVGEKVVERLVRRKSVVLDETRNQYFEYDSRGTDETCSIASGSGTWPNQQAANQNNEPKNENENRNIQYIDVPLFNSRFENTKNDLITGPEIEEELKKLRLVVPLPWSLANNKKFKDLNRTDDTSVICRFCDFYPFTAKNLFEHLISSEHKLKLMEEEISRSSFEYWRQRCEGVAARKEKDEKGGFEESAKKQAKKFKTVPLLDDYKKLNSNEKDLGSPKHLDKLSKAVNAADRNVVNDEKSFLSFFMQAIECPDMCPLCPSYVFPNKRPYSIISHIVSPFHLKLLGDTGYSIKEYSFWMQYLVVPNGKRNNIGKEVKKEVKQEVEKTVKHEVKKEVKKEEKKPEKAKPAQKMQKAKNSVTPYQFKNVPLLSEHFPKTMQEMKKPRRLPSLKRLDVLLRSVDRQKLNDKNSACSKVLNAFLITKESCGFKCGPLKSTDPYSLISHCLTSPHREKLIQFGFGTPEYQFWSNVLGQYLKEKLTAEEVSMEDGSESIADSVRSDDSISISNLKFNSPRLPLIDLDAQNVYPVVNRKSLICELESLWKKVEVKKWKNVGEKILDLNREATCYLCKLRENCFSDCVSLATHVFSPIHMKHMQKIGFSADDYFVWKNCLNRALNGNVPKQTVTQKEKEKPKIAVVQPQIKLNVETSEAIPIPSRPMFVPTFVPKFKVQPNNPRMPLIDPPLPGTELLSKTETRQKLDELAKRRKLVSESLACKMGSTARIYCSICTDKSKPYFFSTIHSAAGHALSVTHRQQMTFEVPQSDFDYWNEFYGKCEAKMALDGPVKNNTRRHGRGSRGNEKNVFEQRSSNAPSKPNFPRIPLLDLPLADIDGKIELCEDFESKFSVALEKWNSVNKEIAEKRMIEEPVFCNVCFEADRRIIGMGSLYEVGEHVFDLKTLHKEKLAQRATDQSFAYWDNVFAKMDKISKKRDNQENETRIPLLDGPVVGWEVLKEEEIDECWENLNKIRDKCKKKYNFVVNKWDKKITCRVCYEKDGYAIVSANLLVNHIFSFVHRNNVKKVGVGKKDVEFWVELSKKEDLKKEKRVMYPIALMYSNTDLKLSDRLEKMKLTEEECAEKFELLRAKVKEAKIFDFNVRFRNLVYQHECRKCLWCGTELHAPAHFLKHVVNAEHEKNVMNKCQVTMKDFDEWFDRLKILDEFVLEKTLRADGIAKSRAAKELASAKAIEEAKKKENAYTAQGLETTNAVVDIVKPVDTMFQKQLLLPGASTYTQPVKPCCSPLFSDTISINKKTKCFGPSLAELFIINYAENKPLIKIEELDKVGCAVCNVDLSACDPCYILRHAFTFEHIEQMNRHGVTLYKEDFEYWGKKIAEAAGISWESHTSLNEKARRFNVYEMEKYPQMFTKKFRMGGNMVFSWETWYSRKNFNRLNSSLFDASYPHLREIGCYFCAQWLNSPSEVAKHAVSKKHFDAYLLTNRRYVYGAELDFWADKIEGCQYPKPVEKPSNSSCVVM